MNWQHKLLLFFLGLGIFAGVHSSLPSNYVEIGSCTLWKQSSGSENLASTLIDSGNFSKSSKLYNEILGKKLKRIDMQHNSFTTERSQVVRDINNQAVALYLASKISERQDKSEIATKLSLEWLSLAEAQSRSMNDDQMLVATLYNRAGILSSENRGAEAEYVFDNASKLRKQLKPAIGNGLLP